MRDVITCEQVREGLREYLDDAAPPGGANAIEHHLRTCPGCAAQVSGLRKTVGFLSALPRPAMPSASREALLEAFRGRPPA